MISHITRLWQQSEFQRTRQQVSRLVLDRITRDLEGAVFPASADSAKSFQFVVNPGVDREIENPAAAFWQTATAGPTTRGDIVEVGYFVRLRMDDKGRGIRGELCRIEVPPIAADSIFNQPDNWLTRDKIETYAPISPGRSNPLKGILAEHVIGLWITPVRGPDVLSGPYDSRKDPQFPTSIEVALAVIDSAAAERIKSTSEVSDHYTAEVKDFIPSLDENLRGSVSILKTRIQLHTTP